MTLREKGRGLESLARLAQAVTASLELPEVLDRVARAVTDLLPDSSARIWVVEGDYLVLRSEAGTLGPPRSGRKTEFAFGEGMTGHVALTREPLVVEDVLADSRTINVEWMRQEGYISFVGIPLVVRDRLVGVIALLTRHRHGFSAEEIEILTSFGTQAAIAIENARLFQENQRKLDELSVLYELSRAVTGQLDVAQLVQAVHQQVGRILDARNMLILLYDEGRREFEVALRMLEGEPDPNPTRRYPLGHGLTSRVIERRQAIRTSNYPETCRQEGLEPVRTSARFPYWLGVPMIAGEQAFGVLALRSAAQPFTEADERLLTNVAGLVALAVRSARFYEEKSRAYGELAAAQDQLVRTEKLRALGEMASGVAHNFNNLLTPILGGAQLLLQKVEDPALRQWLQVIERAATDGARTVRRIQEFTRIRRDQPFVAVDLNQMVQAALEVTRPRWHAEPQSRGIPIQIVTSLAPLPPVAGDPAELREALINLILNAIDAMPKGGTLSLTTETVAERVVVTVSDTGVGMSEEVRRRLFDPFFTTKGPRGTGLGLSITFGIVTRHGGEIAVASVEEKGSTFRLSFPVGQALRIEGERTGASAVPTLLRCLVVDDEPLVREILGELLSQAGHEAVLSADGTDAIARFKAEPFDLVITDLAMPGLNGWQVARSIKAENPSVPVFVITGWGVEVPPEELRARGVDRILSKPVKLDDILSAVAACRPRRSTREGLS